MCEESVFKDMYRVMSAASCLEPLRITCDKAIVNFC